MEYKDLNLFLKDFERSEWEKPRLLLFSGQDMELGELVIRHIKKHLEHRLDSYELLVFSHEPQEAMRLRGELANVPLFNPLPLYSCTSG